jgi:hypothetical protein
VPSLEYGITENPILTVRTVHGEPSPDRETYAKDVADWILARSGDSTVRSKL